MKSSEVVEDSRKRPLNQNNADVKKTKLFSTKEFRKQISKENKQLGKH